MKSVVAIMLVAILFPTAMAAEEPATIFKLTGWTYGRERKTITGSNRVTGSVNVKNASKSTLSDVSASITYTTGLGEEVFKPITQKAGDMKPGESKTLTFVAELVPIFQSYTIVVKFDGSKKEEWFGNSDIAQPEVKTAPVKGEVNVVILGKEATIDKNGLFTGTLHLKNEGSEEAKDMKVFVTFYDMRKKKVKDWSATLGTGTLGGGVEKNIPFTIPDAPKNYGSYAIKLNNDGGTDGALSGGEFTKNADVEFAHFKFTPPVAGKSAGKVDVQCRNGMKFAVNQVKLEVLLFDGKKKEIKRISHEIPGELHAGEIKDISFEVPNLPAFEEYEQRISFGKAAPVLATLAKAAPVQIEDMKFQKKPEVEVIFGRMLVNADKVIELKGAVRNGKNVPVKDIVIHISFVKSSGEELTAVDRTLSSVLKPGEEKEFIVYSNKANGANNCTFTFKFTEVADK